MKRFIYVLLFMPLLAACGQREVIKIRQVDGLTKVLAHDSLFNDQRDTVCVARGECVVMQFVVTSAQNLKNLKVKVKNGGLGSTRIGWVHDVHNTNYTRDADDMLTPSDDMYPDPIIDDAVEDIDTLGHKTLILDIDIPRDASKGLHKGAVTLSGTDNEGKTVRSRKDFVVKVYPVELPKEQKLKVVNWMDWDQFRFLDGSKKVDFHSEKYMEQLKLFAQTASAYGQNCYLLNDEPDLVLNDDSTDFVIDFERYDRMVDIFMKYGNLKYFTGGHLGVREAGWDDGFSFGIYYVKDKKIVYERVPYTDERLRQFIKKYYSQIYQHFKEKGWNEIFYQHIADEPSYKGTESQISWSAVAKMVKEEVPGLRTIDACFELVENMDVCVVLLGDNIDELPTIPKGSERWMYTCCSPVGNYANRFVQLPLIKTRLLHWINFKYNENGYLHWGYNYWSFCKGDPLKEISLTTNWPGGDSHIVYPGKNKLYPSIRLLAMRDGIRDYDLLSMLQEKDAVKARMLCNRVIQARDKYETNPVRFRQIRKEILEALKD